jgi:urocanate hydratase
MFFKPDRKPLDGDSAMTIDSSRSPSFAATVDCLYAGMIAAVELEPALDRERGLGGRLFYAGDLDGAGCALVVAANIAGAATLTASAEIAAQKQAIRDGVIDFLVTSLDEALRILKNELRKGETVAVCAGKPPEEIEREMAERGVLPDLLPPGAEDALRFEAFLAQGARQIEAVTAKESQSVLTWSVADRPAHWLPRLDTVARECIRRSQSQEADAAQRWLRLAPRYLGRMAQGVRLLRCPTDTALDFVERVREQVASGEIAAAVEIRLGGQGDSGLHRFIPPQAEEARQGLTPAGLRQLRSGTKAP